MAQEGKIESIKEYHKDNYVSFKLRIPHIYNKYQSSKEEVIKEFKMQSSLSLRNMVAFNEAGLVTKYNSAFDIIDEFYPVRK